MNGARLLAVYVDDDPDDVFLFEKAWARSALPAVRLATVEGGGAALMFLDEAVRNGVLPDLVLVDLKMSDVSGIEVLRHMTAHTRLAMVPAIVLTSSLLAGDATKALGAGAMACLTKPTEFQEACVLAQRLAAWMVAGMDATELWSLDGFVRD